MAKRSAALLLAILMVLTCLAPTQIFAANDAVDIEFDGTRVWLTSNQTQTVTPIVAAYTAEGAMLEAVMLNETEVSKTATSVDISRLMKTQGQTIHIFVWNSLKDMSPLQEKKTSEVAYLGVTDGTIAFEGINVRKNSSNIPFIVKNSENHTVYFDQLTSDGDGRYEVKFRIADFDENGRYTIITGNQEKTLHTAIFTTAGRQAKLYTTAYADTKVQGGETNRTVNFGTDTNLGCRYYPDDETYHTRSYLKFDISDIPQKGLETAYFQFYPTIAGDSSQSIEVNVYGVDADLWNEKTLTYATQPELGEKLGQGSSAIRTTGMIDITSYVKNSFESGVVSIAIEGGANKQPQAIASREATNAAQRPKLVFSYDGATDIYTDYVIPDYGNGVDPLENAAAMIEASTATYEYPTVSATTQSTAGYTDTVQARLANETDYRTFKTRTVATSGLTLNDTNKNTLSTYGGDSTDKITDGTGYFKVQKDSNDRWTLVDPDGYRFYSTGVTSVRPADDADAYQAVVNEYQGSTQKWAETKRELLLNRGFNTGGGWSFMFRMNPQGTANISGELGYDEATITTGNPMATGVVIPYGVGITYAREIDGVTGEGVEKFKGGVPPVFNPDFEDKCGEIIAKYTEPLKDCPWVIGWWSDNEINDDLLMLDKALALDPTDPVYVYTHATAWAWLRDRLGSEAVGVWDLNDTLREEFREFVYDRYYQVMNRQFAEKAPNHLYLGNRHFHTAVKSKGVFAAAKRYCDVISYNLYQYWTPAIVAEWSQYADVPVLVTEFYSAVGSAAGGWVVPDNSSVGKFYENFTLRLLEAKNVVGWHYHSFSRFDTEGATDELDASATNVNTHTYHLVENFDK